MQLMWNGALRCLVLFVARLETLCRETPHVIVQAPQRRRQGVKQTVLIMNTLSFCCKHSASITSLSYELLLQGYKSSEFLLLLPFAYFPPFPSHLSAPSLLLSLPSLIPIAAFYHIPLLHYPTVTVSACLVLTVLLPPLSLQVLCVASTNKSTPLHQAAAAGQAGVLECLLEVMKTVADDWDHIRRLLDQQDQQGQTPLMLACKGKRYQQDARPFRDW
jgi:hypothetical protein